MSQVPASGPTKSKHISEKPLSQRPLTKYQRDRLLADDALRDRQNKLQRKYRAKKKESEVSSKATLRVRKSSPKTKEKSVRHHLARGRDIGDIAVREGWLVSDVQAVIDRMNAEAAR